MSEKQTHYFFYFCYVKKNQNFFYKHFLIIFVKKIFNYVVIPCRLIKLRLDLGDDILLIRGRLRSLPYVMATPMKILISERIASKPFLLGLTLR
jgi:hypothetical protein